MSIESQPTGHEAAMAQCANSLSKISGAKNHEVVATHAVFIEQASEFASELLDFEVLLSAIATSPSHEQKPSELFLVQPDNAGYYRTLIEQGVTVEQVVALNAELYERLGSTTLS